MIKSCDDIRNCQVVFGYFYLLLLLKGEQRNFLKKYKEANDNNIVSSIIVKLPLLLIT